MAHASACRCGLQPTPGPLLQQSLQGPHQCAEDCPISTPRTGGSLSPGICTGVCQPAIHRRASHRPGKAFVSMDRYLDTTRAGPMFLRRPEVAASVVQELQRGVALLYYDLRAFVVMGNQIHALLRPQRAGQPRTAVAERGYGSPSQSVARTNGTTVLAAGILRPCGPGGAGTGTYRRLRREQPRESRIGR